MHSNADHTRHDGRRRVGDAGQVGRRLPAPVVAHRDRTESAWRAAPCPRHEPILPGDTDQYLKNPILLSCNAQWRLSRDRCSCRWISRVAVTECAGIRSSKRTVTERRVDSVASLRTRAKGRPRCTGRRWPRSSPPAPLSTGPTRQTPPRPSRCSPVSDQPPPRWRRAGSAFRSTSAPPTNREKCRTTRHSSAMAGLTRFGRWVSGGGAAGRRGHLTLDTDARDPRVAGLLRALLLRLLAAAPPRPVLVRAIDHTGPTPVFAPFAPLVDAGLMPHPRPASPARGPCSPRRSAGSSATNPASPEDAPRGGRRPPPPRSRGHGAGGGARPTRPRSTALHLVVAGWPPPPCEGPHLPREHADHAGRGPSASVSAPPGGFGTPALRFRLAASARRSSSTPIPPRGWWPGLHDLRARSPARARRNSLASSP